jgi:hypothetical protein
MTIPDDNSIPFPYDSPQTWDQLRLKGLSGQEYVWPTDPRFGVVRFKITPPEIRIKKSVRAGAKKPKVKDVGSGLTKASVSLEVVKRGWPSFVANVWRLIDESIDGPWRLLHPLVDTFDARSFKVATYMKIEDYYGGKIAATFELLELDPDEQAGLGKNVGTVATGSAAQQYALEAEAHALFQAQQARLIQERAEELDAQRRADALRKPGVLVAKYFPVSKAVAYGKIEP